MKKLKTLFLFLHKKRYVHFFATGVVGIVLNILTVWFFTEFVFGIDYYLVGYLIGAVVNVTYNFTLHTIMTFQTKREHAKRFVYFILFSMLSACVQVVIIRALTEYFGREYYLLIIAGSILLLSFISFVFFKHSLFKEDRVEEIPYATPKEELIALQANARLALSRVNAFISKDKNVLIVIFILAILTRLPLLNHPDRTVFDEAIYTNYAMHTVNHVPFFDIHPPLARMIFAGIASNSPFKLWAIPIETNNQFGDFPYETLRLFIALFGILLPLLLYLIGRLLKYPPYAAGVIALFAVFDNALVLYSRTILPDTLLLFFNFLGFAAAIAAVQMVNQHRHRILLVLLSGIALGLAVSIKWTALAVLAIVWIVFLFARMYRAIIVTGILVIFSYLFIFSIYFTHFPEGGRVDPMLFAYNKQWIVSMSFPRGTNIKEVIEYIPEFHQMMLQANTDSDISKATLQSEGPIAWPMAQTFMTWWIGDYGKQAIVLRGNEFLWFMTFFMILFEIGWIATRGILKRSWPIDKNETILLLGYIFNYAPFFLIHRPMYLYHYFTAFIFSLLLLPRVAPRIITCIANITHDKALAKTIMYFSILLVIINFFLLARTTYGF